MSLYGYVFLSCFIVVFCVNQQATNALGMHSTEEESGDEDQRPSVNVNRMREQTNAARRNRFEKADTGALDRLSTKNSSDESIVRMPLVPPGDRYVGSIQNGKKHGYGTYSHKGSVTYSGRWQDNKKHGDGTAFNADGSIYAGQFKGDHENGIGVLSRPNGEKYRGNWAQGVQHGEGVIVRANGDSYKGRWNHGRLDESSVQFLPKTGKDGDEKSGSSMDKRGVMPLPDADRSEDTFHTTEDNEQAIDHTGEERLEHIESSRNETSTADVQVMPKNA